MSNRRDPRPPPSLADDPEWDAVDQAGWESFPSSDPPSYGSSRAAPSRTSLHDATVQAEADLVARRRTQGVRIAAAGAAAAGVGLLAFALWRRFRVR